MCEHRYPIIRDGRVTYDLTDCLQAYELRGAGAVMHSHSLNAVMATLLDTSASEFTVTNLEMIKASQCGCSCSVSTVTKCCMQYCATA